MGCVASVVQRRGITCTKSLSAGFSHAACTLIVSLSPLTSCNARRLAELLDVQRIGPQHQAGSDSLLTSLAFIKLATKYFQASTWKIN